MVYTKELKVGEHYIYYDGSEKIIYVIANGDSDLEMATKIRDFHYSIHKEEEGEISTLIDLNKSGKSTPEARQIWKELSDGERSKKTAFVGLHAVARVMAAFIMKVFSKNNCRFFSNKEEAVDWLRA